MLRRIRLYRSANGQERERDKKSHSDSRESRRARNGRRDEDDRVAKKEKKDGTGRGRKEIRRARDDARITSRERKASARLRYIKYNYSDSKKRAQVETYDNMVHGGLRSRSGRM